MKKKKFSGSLPLKIMNNDRILSQYMNINTGYRQLYTGNSDYLRNVRLPTREGLEFGYSCYNSNNLFPSEILNINRRNTSINEIKNRCNIMHCENENRNELLRNSIDYVKKLSISNKNKLDILDKQLNRLAVYEEKLESKRREFKKIVYGFDDYDDKDLSGGRDSKEVHTTIYKYPIKFSLEETNLAMEYLYEYKNTDYVIATNKRANLELSIEDIKCLKPQRWLNDEVINFYFSLLQERNDRANSCGSKPKIWFWNTFFYSRLTANQNGNSGYCYSNVSRWTTRKKIDIFNYNLVIIPINTNNVHWTLGVVNFDEDYIMYLDSLGGKYQNHVGCSKMSEMFYNNMTRYIYDEHLDKKKKEFNGSLKHYTIFKDPVPQQQNGSDCGIFTCMFAECISDGRSFDFNVESIDDIRVNILVECIRNSIQ
ncbi:ULP1 like chllamydin domain containing protease [Cryptosporidium xiaoi]|uniref:ULP1 like chllamydin domain containing protease n=1 Tax=Cryptosporidium xiaoi TaxID=659607 RepID=A0AAV9XZB0_9CRYT